MIKEDIGSKIDAITNFPKDAETPIVSQMIKHTPVLSIAISGNVDQNSLFNLTKIIKDELDAIDGINLTKIGVPKTKAIFVKPSRSALLKHGISMIDIEREIRSNSIEMPGGKLESSYDKKTIRLKQKSKTSQDVGAIDIYSIRNDSKIKLKDIAYVYESFKDEDIKITFNNSNASFIDVFRIGSQNALEVSEKVNIYVNSKNKSLPEEVKLSIWNDESIFLKGRLELLLKNALIGLVLVMFVLSLFLKPKFAFWVSLGIPISFLGALWLFPGLDV